MNFIFEVHLRITTNPLGSRSNPEGSKIEPLWVRSRTQKGSKIEPFWVRVFEPRRVHVFEPFWVRDRTQRVRSSNPLGSTNPEGFVSLNPSGFEIEPRGFDLRTLWRVRDRTLLGSISNPLGSTNPEGFEDRTLWVPRTQKGSKIEPSWVSNPLGSWNPEGSKIEPFWVRDRTQKGSIFEPSGFNLEPRGFVVLRR
ncbi:hypothetical protein ACOSQ4_021338 [Xanthoceras sorbifolium]